MKYEVLKQIGYEFRGMIALSTYNLQRLSGIHKNKHDASITAKADTQIGSSIVNTDR